MAAIAQADMACPGCGETLTLTLRLDKDAPTVPGELVLAVDRSLIEQHIATHSEAEGS